MLTHRQPGAERRDDARNRPAAADRRALELASLQPHLRADVRPVRSRDGRFDGGAGRVDGHARAQPGRNAAFDSDVGPPLLRKSLGQASSSFRPRRGPRRSRRFSGRGSGSSPPAVHRCRSTSARASSRPACRCLEGYGLDGDVPRRELQYGSTTTASAPWARRFPASKSRSPRTAKSWSAGRT